MIGISVIFPSKQAPKPPHRAAFFYYLRSTQEPQVLAFCSSSLVLIVCSRFGEHTATNWEECGTTDTGRLKNVNILL